MTSDQDDYVPETANGAGDPPDEVAALRQEAADMRERMLRALADAENTRRRAERDREESRQYAVTSFARDMLNVADNFQRAVDSLPEGARADLSPQAKAVIEGIEATERQLLGVLERHGVRRIETAGAKFDPNLHQAIAEVPGEGRPPGTIVNTVQTGYVIADRLLRPAMVTVAARDQSPPASGPAPGGALDTTA
ncbi:MAG: nucleotide exchange factor GrpE [Rhizomicrobium sp.]|jgi:molecular chaperone GrpE